MHLASRARHARNPKIKQYKLFDKNEKEFKDLLGIDMTNVTQVRDHGRFTTWDKVVDKINEKGGINTNKFLAYLALNNSATDIWENFDIDKAIVVEDWETEVNGIVDSIDEYDYNIVRKEMPINISHMDGCGIMLHEKTRMVRLPWIKGLLVRFPFDKFIKEKCNNDAIVYDIYGKEHDLVKEDIHYIFTKSQFKLWKYYSSFDEYKDLFKKYNCEACFCNEEEDNIQSAKIKESIQKIISLTVGRFGDKVELSYSSFSRSPDRR